MAISKTLKKILFISFSVVFFPILFLSAYIVCLIIWSNLYPVEVTKLNNGYFKAEITIELWGNKGDGHYIINIKNKYGEYRQDLWTDWGPAQRANFYRTEQGWLAILGGGNLRALIEIPENNKVSSIPFHKWDEYKILSENWEYLGSTNGFEINMPFRTTAERG